MDCLILFNTTLYILLLDTDIQHYSQNVVIGKCHNHNFLCCGYGPNGCDVFSTNSIIFLKSKLRFIMAENNELL